MGSKLECVLDFIIWTLLSFIDPGNTAEPWSAQALKQNFQLESWLCPCSSCSRGRLPQPSCASVSQCATWRNCVVSLWGWSVCRHEHVAACPVHRTCSRRLSSHLHEREIHRKLSVLYEVFAWHQESGEVVARKDISVFLVKLLLKMWPWFLDLFMWNLQN